MPSVTTYRFAGITFQVTSDLPPFGFLADHLEQFTIPVADADVHVTFQRVDCPTSASRHNDLLLWQLAPLLGYPAQQKTSPLLDSHTIRQQLHRCLKRSTTCRVEVRRNTITIDDFAMRQMTVFYRPDSPFSNTTNRQLGFSLFAPYLADFDANMVHSSCVIRGDAAALFIAPDEGGKTTIATHAPENTILCDDQNIFRRHEDTFFAYGTPWGRHFDPVARAPLRALFFLEKAPRFGLTPITPREAMGRIWLESATSTTRLPGPIYAQSVALLHALTHHVPSYTLRFAKNDVDWHMVDTVLHASTHHPRHLVNF